MRRRVMAAVLIFVLCGMMMSCSGGTSGGGAAGETTVAAESSGAADSGQAGEAGEAGKTGEAETTTGSAGLAAKTPASQTTAAAENGENENAEETGAAPIMTLDDFPVTDGSLACVPMIEELMMRFTGCTEMQADERVNEVFSNTNPCYLNLAAGERDLCIAYEPAEETVEKLKDYPPLDKQPIGKDALVFIVNENNPVDELSKQQLMDIFTGKIHNWKEVGGADVPIQVFTRPETSGSQTLMRKLLVGDAEMTDEKYYYMQPTMEGMVEAIKENYDNSEMAIGYSVYYYVESMMGTSGLKFLKVDGVDPSTEAIAGGEYSLVNDFYAVVREDSPEKALQVRDWLLSEEGQTFVGECGYVPVR